MFEFEKIHEGVFIFKGGVHCGVIISNCRMLLIDCCDMLPGKVHAHFGISRPDMILFTQYRRPNTCGIYEWSGSRTKMLVPMGEQPFFNKVETYWGDPKFRWRAYEQMPSSQVLPENVQETSAVREGDTFEWEGCAIRVLDTPGATFGGVSYLLEKGGRTFCFCGDLIFGDGKAWDVYSLQKGYGCSDYHGFMGNWKKLRDSLTHVLEEKAEMLIPSHGEIIERPERHAVLLIHRLESLYENYSSISSMNHYFPEFQKHEGNVDAKMKPAASIDLPEFVQPMGSTSSVIISKTGAGFLVDCGSSEVLDNLAKRMNEGMLNSLEACWVTHCHDDHSDCLGQLQARYGCPIYSCHGMKDVLEHPDRYFLPCLSPNPVGVTGLKHGYRWNWNEFTMTAFDFPGQSLYHGALLVEESGMKALFVGDSFTPSGVDDYCCGNRNFLGTDRGFRQCINLIRRIEPDYLINQHHDKAFRFTEDELGFMEKTLVQREKLLSDVLAWDNPNFGTDEWWVRAYPYSQKASTGSDAFVHVFFTNHGNHHAIADAEPVLPRGWGMDVAAGQGGVIVPAGTGGHHDAVPQDSGAGGAGVPPEPDARICFRLSIPAEAEKKLFVIPFRIFWAGSYLGQIRHALIQVE